MSRDLRIYVFLEIALGFGALAIATVLLPVEGRIGIALSGVPSAAANATGVLFWVALTLAGSALVSERPTGAITTFDLPFIAAATVLGGPVAGGWVAMIGSFGLRELRGLRQRDAGSGGGNQRHVPWYGILANHAMSTFPAIVGGVAVLAARPFLDPLLEANTSAGDLAWTLLVAAIIVALNNALAFETLALRSDRSFGDVLEDFGRDYWLMMAAEAVVAWLMVEVALLAGWWAPIVCLAALLAIWQGRRQDPQKVDPLTGLWNAPEFLRRTSRLLERWHRGGRRVVVMAVELENLELVNRQYGRDVGDRVLKAVADRLRASLRPLDDVARVEAGTFAALLLLPRIDRGPDQGADPAEAIAGRIHPKITGDLDVEGRSIEIRASIAVAFEVRRDHRATAEELLDWAKSAARRALDRGLGW